ncbi:hypothetical protein SPHINGO391_470117 [Sphingomonas aurantiaca]|uniref:Uncharacterized protein n=1 Tax=Sphingomonas aurantiaca TaxID=185949 RepID=A0A5E7ZUM0_9SPHN|nr:hypothetical protein SPHINGO391_470117 [Sphingomonas aurantiaca]
MGTVPTGRRTPLHLPFQLGPGLRRGGQAIPFQPQKPIGTKFVHLRETFPKAAHYPGNTSQRVTRP